MRRIPHLAVALLCLFIAGRGRADAQNARPQFRPAVLVTGRESLINRIDAEGLVQAGQTGGAVMFSARATKEGRLIGPRVFRGTPGTEKLSEEVLKKLADTKVAPAIYNYQPVETIFYGAVDFSVTAGKPLVRIFLNQDLAELKKGSDFIGPQPVIGGDSAFSGLHFPESARAAAAQGVVALSLKVDATGALQELHVMNEDPPALGFGSAAEADLKGAKFIPAFRLGDADASDTVIGLCYSRDQAQ